MHTCSTTAAKTLNNRSSGKGAIFCNLTSPDPDLYVTGHGSSLGYYARRTWQDAATGGTPAVDEA